MQSKEDILPIINDIIKDIGKEKTKMKKTITGLNLKFGSNFPRTSKSGDRRIEYNP
jgi:hypothetical protein